MSNKSRAELEAAIVEVAGGGDDKAEALERLNRARRRHPVSVLAIGARRVGMERAVRAVEYIVAVEVGRECGMTELKALASWWGIGRASLYRYRTDFLLAFPGLDTRDFVTTKKPREEIRRLADELRVCSPAERRRDAASGVADFASGAASGAVAAAS